MMWRERHSAAPPFSLSAGASTATERERQHNDRTLAATGAGWSVEIAIPIASLLERQAVAGCGPDNVPAPGGCGAACPAVASRRPFCHRLCSDLPLSH